MSVHMLTAMAAGMAMLLACYLLLGEHAGAAPLSNADVHPQLSGLTKAQAEDVLDWLEAHGRSGCTVCIDDAGRFTVNLPQANVPSAK